MGKAKIDMNRLLSELLLFPESFCFKASVLL